MKTKKYVKLLVWLVPVVMAALWQGCSEGTVVDDESDHLVPLQVGVSLRGEFLGTRSATTVESASIGVFLSEDKAAGYAPLYNVKYASDGSGVWQPSDASKQIFLRKSPAKVIAYYDPEGLVTFRSDHSSVTQTPLIAQPYSDVRSAEAVNPLWYIGLQVVSKSNPTATFALKPVYANVRLILTREKEYVGSCAIDKVSFSYGPTGVICRSASFDVASETIVTDGTEDISVPYEYNPMITGIAEGVTDSSISVLLPPQDIVAGLTITLTIDETVREVTVPYASLPKLAMGSQYNIPLKITAAAMLTISSSVTEQEWNASDMGTITDTSDM